MLRNIDSSTYYFEDANMSETLIKIFTVHFGSRQFSE